jgi:hypothetical protein
VVPKSPTAQDSPAEE